MYMEGTDNIAIIRTCRNVSVLLNICRDFSFFSRCGVIRVIVHIQA